MKKTIDGAHGGWLAAVLVGAVFGLCSGLAALAAESRLIDAGLAALAAARFQRAFVFSTATFIAITTVVALSWHAARNRWHLSWTATALGSVACAAAAGAIALGIALKLGLDLPWVRLDSRGIVVEISWISLLPLAAGTLWLASLPFAAVFRRPAGRRVLWTVLALALLVNLTAVAERLRGSAGLPNPANVLLISVDTLRPDHFSHNGYPMDTTPNIDAIASRLVRFKQAFTPMAHTLPAHTSMLTGLEPNSHGLRMNGTDLADDVVTLTEILKDRGYRTAAVVSSPILEAERGLARGFDVYDDDLGGADYRRADAVLEPAYEWLDADDDRPFFLFLHFWDMHDPYDPPEPFDTVFSDAPVPEPHEDLYSTGRYDHELLRERLPDLRDDEIPGSVRDQIRAYNGELRYLDDRLGAFAEYLERRGLWDDTILVITADHGESLGERGWTGHGLFYEEQIRVPLFIKPPKYDGAGRDVEQVVMLTDITPTIAHTLGIDLPHDVDGRSLMPELTERSTPEPRTVYLERREFPASMRVKSPLLWGLGKELAIRKADWKLIYRPAEDSELYNLVADPLELRNRIEDEPEVAGRLETELLDWFGGTPDASEEDVEGMDARTLEQLKSLGYIR